MPSTRGAVVLMLLSVVLFAGNTLLIRAIGDLGSVNAWIVSTFRFLAGFAVLYAFFYRRGGFHPRHMISNPLLILRGVLGGVGVWIFYLTIVELGAGRATFISNTYVVFGAVMAGVFLREKLTGRVVVSLVLSMIGLALLTGITDLHAPDKFETLGIIGAIVAGAVVVCIRRLHQKENSSTIFGAQCFYGILLSAGPTALHGVPLSGLVIALLVTSGLLAAFGQLSMTQAYRDLPVAQGSIMQLLLPPLIALGGYLFFGETFTAIELVGAGLILAACLVTARARPRLAAARAT
ncbi:MAG: DMT family transporter [Opitutaceae bacterium]